MPPGPRPEGDPLQRALADLCSLAWTGRGVLEAIACGPAAIPRLRDILFAREPSGLSETRCAAAEALGALRAEAVLIDFLAAPHKIDDPVERVGIETVMDCAARVLLQCDDPRLPPLLLRLAETRLLPAAIAWLGARRRTEAVDCLITALGDDIARPAAETALVALGAAAGSALWHAASDPRPSSGAESDTSRRRRRAALSVLLRLGTATSVPKSALEVLAADPDAAIATAALRLYVDIGTWAECRTGMRRLIAVLDRADIGVCADIEECLMTHPNLARATLAEQEYSALLIEAAGAPPQRRVLRRVAARLGILSPAAASSSAPT